MHPVYVLIGGQSRRFGADKCSVEVDGAPWALHVANRLAAGGEIAMVGHNAPSDSLADERFIADAPPALGPLSGALAAVRDRRDGLLVLASCDLVRPERGWLEPLNDAFDADPSLEVAAFQASGRWQPFPSVVHTRWAPRLTALIGSGLRSFQQALDASHTAAIPWRDVPAAERRADGPPQANCPQELERLLAAEA